MPLAAYIDESADGKGNILFVLGGWIAPLDAWQTFDESWREITNRYGLSEYHAHDCTQCEKEFKGWPSERITELQGELLTVLETTTPTGIGVSLNIEDYGQHPKSKFLPHYHACWQYLLIEATRKVPDGMQVSFVLDKRDKIIGKADRIRLLMKENVSFEDREKIGTVVTQSSHAFPPLQAADWLVYEILRHATGKKTTEEGEKLRNGFLVTYQEFCEGNINTLFDELTSAGFFNERR